MSLLVTTLIACHVDTAGSLGEEGRLAFHVASDWELDEDNLREVDLVTGHPVSIQVDATIPGEQWIGSRGHRVAWNLVPDSDVELDPSAVEEGERGDDLRWSVRATVDAGGERLLEAWIGDERLDWLPLTWARPDNLELTLFVREPWEDDWTEAEAPLRVPAGTQLSWLVIPRLGDARLHGQVHATMSAEPRDAVAPGENVWHTNEEEVVGDPSETLYFVDEGEVVVTISDEVNGVAEDLAVTVTSD